MRANSIVPLAVIALASTTGCLHVEETRVPAPPIPPQAEIHMAADVKEARAYIKERLEAEILHHRVKVDTLRLITPAFEGEYVFVANTTTVEGPSPALTRQRIIGSVYLKPTKKLEVWKARAL